MNIDKIKKIIVLGLGKSGCAAVELADEKGIAVSAFDESNSPRLKNFKKEKPGISIELDWRGTDLPDADIIVISPGIAPASPLRIAAKKKRIPIISELDFAYNFCGKPLIAITGTNGKTTVTELTNHILSSMGFKTVAAGNIGLPLSKIAENPEAYDFIVTEVSSFQLEDCVSFTAKTAAVLNLTSDHMNRYVDGREYARTKFKIFKNIKSGDNIIVNHNIYNTWKSLSESSLTPVTFSAYDHEASFFLSKDGSIMRRENGRCEHIMNFSETKMTGLHNAENIMASLALVFSILRHPPCEEIIKAVCEFRTGPHRMEIVAERNGIKYINDSKATNPDAVVFALKTFGGEKNVCLIAGGLDKNMDFSPILEEKNRIKAIFLMGETKNKLANLLERDIRCYIFNTFKEAVFAACDKAETGDVVMLSPACASMDMFKDYQERGNKFTELIKLKRSI